MNSPLSPEENKKLLEIIASKHSKCAWISHQARNMVDAILFGRKTIDEAYDELQSMRKAVRETPGAC